MAIEETQTLMSFSGALRQDVHKFEQFWFQRNLEDPKTWPLTMSAAEWENHYTAWRQQNV